LVLDEDLRVTFGYKNNTAKDIFWRQRLRLRRGFSSGRIVRVPDLERHHHQGGRDSHMGCRSVHSFARGNNKDRKLADLNGDKFKVVWKPQVIVFSDGSKLSLPAD